MITVLTACLLAGAAGQVAVFSEQEPARNTSAPRVSVNEHVLVSPSAAGLQGYSVVLVVGDMQSAGTGESVPPAARKALADMQAFLPYKRYQLLDASWMMCCGTYRSSVVGRLRGPEDREYSYSIDTLPGEAGKLTVRFWLRDGDAASTPVAVSAGGMGVGGGGVRAQGGQQPSLSDTARAEYSRQLYDAQKERDEAEIQLRRIRQRVEVGLATPTEAESATMRYQLARTRVDELERTLGKRSSSGGGASAGGSRANVLDSTFSIAIGETVVIGTSRLKGDQALIALLTAAGKPAPAR